MNNDILTIICDYFKTDKAKVLSKSRKAELVNSRRYFAYFSKLYFPKKTFLDIGKQINLDHSTVIFSINKINSLKDVYPDVRKTISELTYLIENNHVKTYCEREKWNGILF